jgi:hypothetical protein
MCCHHNRSESPVLNSGNIAAVTSWKQKCCLCFQSRVVSGVSGARGSKMAVASAGICVGKWHQCMKTVGWWSSWLSHCRNITLKAPILLLKLLDLTIKMIKIQRYKGNICWCTCRRKNKVTCPKWRLGSVVVKGVILKRIGIAESSSVYKSSNKFEKCLTWSLFKRSFSKILDTMGRWLIGQ